MGDEKQHLTLISAILQGVYLAVKYVVFLLIVAAISWFGTNYFLDRNPEVKARLQQSYDAMVALSALKQTGGDALISVNPQPNYSGISQGQVGRVTRQWEDENTVFEPTMPNYEKEYADIPAALVPFAEAMELSFGTTKYRTRLSVDQVGHDGSGAIPYLEKALNSPELRVRTAAEESLMRIGTPEAQAVLRAARGQ